jgi:hypothetical protein
MATLVISKTHTRWSRLRSHWHAKAFCRATALPDLAVSNVTACRYPFGLLDIDFSNNSGITGIVPAQMGCAALLASYSNALLAMHGVCSATK